jgi:hypothetical protein
MNALRLKVMVNHIVAILLIAAIITRISWGVRIMPAVHAPGTAATVSF